MEKFGHFFEFFAALNSAYIASTHFIRVLSLKIYHHFKDLKKEFDLVFRLHTENCNELISGGAKCSTASIVEELNDENSKISEKIKIYKNDVLFAMENAALSNNFNFMCLYASLYSILILVLNGYEFDFSDVYKREVFAFFNVISILFLLLLFKEKKWKFFKKLHPSYSKVIYAFFTFIGLSFVVYFFIEGKPFFYCKYDFTWLNIILCVAFPTSHFIYYFLKSGKEIRKKTSELKGRISTIKGECTTFATRMSASFKTAEKITKEKG